MINGHWPSVNHLKTFIDIRFDRWISFIIISLTSFMSYSGQYSICHNDCGGIFNILCTKLITDYSINQSVSFSQKDWRKKSGRYYDEDNKDNDMLTMITLRITTECNAAAEQEMKGSSLIILWGTLSTLNPGLSGLLLWFWNISFCRSFWHWRWFDMFGCLQSLEKPCLYLQDSAAP